VNTERVQKATLWGSVLSALMASICCLGPIVFAVLGISGAGFILRFEAFRPYFTVAAALLLGAAFYFTYRKKPAEECAPGSHCANPRADKINKIVLWVATILVGFFIFFPEIISRFV